MTVAKRIEFEETIADAEQKVLASVPGATIPIVTGGEKVGAVSALGPEILVEVTDVCDPKNTGVWDYGVSSRSGKWSWAKKIPFGRPVMLPQRIVEEIEGTSERNMRRISEDSAMYGRKAEAEAMNPGMRYIETGDGPFLLREFRRYIVRRVSSEEMRMRGR